MSLREHQHEISILRNWVLVPAIILSFIMTFILSDFMITGILYLVMGLFSIMILSLDKFSRDAYGIGNSHTEYGFQILIGLGFFVGMFLVSKIIPGFALLTPKLSLSIVSDVRFFILVFLAPWLEETWRSAVLGFLRGSYDPEHFAGVNVAQAGVFASIHVLVYGVVLEAYSNWIQVYGSTIAISGSLIAAFVFGLLSGFIMEKTESTLPSQIAHMLINFSLVIGGLVVTGLSYVLLSGIHL